MNGSGRSSGKSEAPYVASSQSAVDIAANRCAKKWSRREQFGRALWDLAHPLFAWSPRMLWGWRRFLLRCFGAEIGRSAHIYPSVRISIPWNITIADHAAIGDRVILYALGPIHVGRAATISQGAHLCAGSHEYRDPTMPLMKLPIKIGDEAWICADAFIGPDVTVGDLAIVGARAVAVKDVPEGMIVAGNPARIVRERPPFASDDENSLTETTNA